MVVIVLYSYDDGYPTAPLGAFTTIEGAFNSVAGAHSLYRCGGHTSPDGGGRPGGWRFYGGDGVAYEAESFEVRP